MGSAVPHAHGNGLQQRQRPPDRPRGQLADAGGPYVQVSASGSRRRFEKYRFKGKARRLALAGSLRRSA